MHSKVLGDWANICWRAWLTSVRVEETEYNEMTKLSMRAMPSVEGVSGLSIRRQSVVVSSMPVCSILRKQISFPCQKGRMCYLILSGHGMREELLPWRKTSYCRCHELKCSEICFQLQVKSTVCQRQYNWITISLVRLCQCRSQYSVCAYNRAILHSLHATTLSCRTPHGYMALADIQTHQRLVQDSPK